MTKIILVMLVSLLAVTTQAKEMDSSVCPSATLQNDLKANLGFKLLEAGINITALKDGTPSTLAGSRF